MITELTLEDRVRRLEDRAEIIELTATYAHYVDRGYNNLAVNSAGLGAVFTEDASWDYPALGMNAAGKDAVIAMLTSPEGSPALAMHSFTNPRIHLNSDRATASWLIWVGQNTGAEINEVFQSEEIAYARVDGEWRIAGITLQFGALLTGAPTAHAAQ